MIEVTNFQETAFISAGTNGAESLTCSCVCSCPCDSCYPTASLNTDVNSYRTSFPRVW